MSDDNQSSQNDNNGQESLLITNDTINTQVRVGINDASIVVKVAD